MSRMRGSTLAAVVCILSGMLMRAGEASAESFSLIRLRHAVLVSDAGFPADAHSLVESVLDDRDGPDGRYLRARLARELSLPLAAALEDLSVAVSSGNFVLFGVTDALLLQARLQLRTGDVSGAAATIGSLDEHISVRSSHPALAAQVLYAIGDEEEAIAVLRSGLQQHPSDAELYRLLIRYDKLTRDQLLSSFYEGEGRARSPAADNPDVLSELVLLSSGHDGAPAVLERYLEVAGPEHPRHKRMGLERTLRDVPLGAESMRGVIADGLLLDLGHLERMAQVPMEDDAREVLADHLARLTGTIEGDRDEDGYSEIRVEFEDGVVTSFRQDLNQDHVAEFQYFFDEDGARVVISSDLVTTTVFYESYPWVRSVMIEDGGEAARIVYRFETGALALSLVRFDEDTLIPIPRRDTGEVPERADLVRTAHSAEVRTAGPGYWLVRPSGNEAFRGEQYVLTHGAPVLIIDVQDGTPVLQRRDVNHDGVLDTSDQVRDESLVRTTHRAGADGYLVYSVEWAEGLASWNFGGDGSRELRTSVVPEAVSVDTRVFELAGAVHRREAP